VAKKGNAEEIRENDEGHFVERAEMTPSWLPIEGTVEEILTQNPRPFYAMRVGEIPAVIVRGAMPSDDCKALVHRFHDRGLIYDPHHRGDGTPVRVDIGTSFGRYANDPDQFFAHSADTHKRFVSLFDDHQDPVKTLYGSLSRMLPDKRVMNAREPEGQLYGPAIFRIYHEGLGHHPHYDSVSKRSKRYEYTVSRFKHQYAGVICFQNSVDHEVSAQSILYRAPMTPEIQPHLENRTFHMFADDNDIERVQIHLEPGDLYYFYSETIHEVPFVVGPTPRIVLASFIGMSQDDPEVFLWS
jgi:hypothetical protein